MAKSNIKTDQPNHKLLKVFGAIVLVAAIGVVLVWFKVSGSMAKPTSELSTFVAKRGPLTISVLVTGTIKAREQTIITNQVEGRTTITYLIPEGTRVKKGELLVELDASTLKDNKIDQDIRVQNAEASFVNAKENLAIMENQAQSDVDVAELKLEFAKQDLEKYTQGEYPNELAKAENDIRLAKEELTRAQEKLKWSQTLYDEKYLSKTELQADQLAESRANVNLEVSNNDLELLKNYNYKRQIAQLTSDVNQAEMSLERTEAKARANLVQAKADLKAKEQEYNRQKDKFSKLEDQLKKTRIEAPTDGMVIYATSAQRGGFHRDNLQPLDEGVEVFERQELIYLPTATSSMAEVNIHEASLQKVRLGLPAVITVDALPGKKFLGTVARIAPLPDAQSMWMNPDIKVYNSDVYLEGEDQSLRTGMSCKVEIIAAQYENVVYVPVWTVLRIGTGHAVFVVKNGSIEERQVEIGFDNYTMVMIVSGLSEGENVMLTPPLKSATIEPGSQGTRTGSRDSNDTSDSLRDGINQRLERANGGKTETQQPQSAGGGPTGSDGQGQTMGRPGTETSSPEMSSEQREQMRQRFQNMSPEEREKMKQAFQNMSPEEREKMRQRSQGQQGQQGTGSPDSGRSRRQGQGRSQGQGGNQ